jgi:polyisoprenoid-binding protein YceI
VLRDIHFVTRRKKNEALICLSGAAFLAFMALTGLSPVGAADGFAVDPAHSSVVFKIQHAGISWIFGRFNEMSGDFAIDKQDPAKPGR